MATWYAVTAIKHGSRDGEEYTRTEFKPGDKVTGLSVDDMKGLFHNGAISKTRPDWLEDDEDDEEPTEENTTPKKPTPAKKTTPAAAPTPPAPSQS